MAPPIPPEASKEIEFVKSLVARRFPVYDVRVSYDVVEFFCRIDDTTLEENFERLREDMAGHGYIPMITYDKGEHIVTVAKKPAAKYRSVSVNLAMLVVTFLTMLLAGVLNWSGYAGVDGGAFFNVENLLMGMITFTLPLMAILGVHELGHFLVARRRGVAASLPFFIPSIPPLGTFGAFISLRDPIPNKKTLLEIGVAGPLAGLLVALPLGIIGLILTNSEARLVPTNVGSEGVMGISFPLIYQALELFIPLRGEYLLHPTAFAAWVGFLVTALNLLPVGQLDGGHVARALLGARAKYLSWVTVAILVGIGMFYYGWLIFALLILFLGTRHPPPLNDISPLDRKRKGLGVLTFAVLVIAFVPIPMTTVTADYSFELQPIGVTNATIALGGSYVFNVTVDNTGNTLNDIAIADATNTAEWNAVFKLRSQDDSHYAEDMLLELNSGENATISVRVSTPPSAQYGQSQNVTIKGITTNGTVQRTLSFNLTVTNPLFTFWVSNSTLTASPGSSIYTSILVNNTGETEANITLDATV
ncbi:MAG: site-2 protease family protein, partial [Candidatus Thermoplasmatota archaeon]|nr:site-2 protease family protein [Candidatus Thermoplasmatota archaeon]